MSDLQNPNLSNSHSSLPNPDLSPLPNPDTHVQSHIHSGQYLKSLIYGGMDSVVNTLSVIIGGSASGTQPKHIVAIGLSVIIGDGIGMGLGDYLSAKAEKQFILSEEKREFWEVENKLEAEKSQIVEIYVEKDYTLEQSRRLAELFATNHQAFVNVMMLQQLGLVVDDSNPMINGIINFLSFLILGFFPYIPYIIGYYGNHDNSTQYLWTLAIGGGQLLILGYLKSMIIGLSQSQRILSAVEMVILGAAATAAEFGIGKIFQGL